MATNTFVLVLSLRKLVVSFETANFVETLISFLCPFVYGLLSLILYSWYIHEPVILGDLPIDSIRVLRGRRTKSKFLSKRMKDVDSRLRRLKYELSFRTSRGVQKTFDNMPPWLKRWLRTTVTAGPREDLHRFYTDMNRLGLVGNNHKRDKRMKLPQGRDFRLKKEDFFTKDGNSLYNKFVLDLLRTGAEERVSLRGSIRYGTSRWNFPVFCSYAEFVYFIETMSETKIDWRPLFCDGILTREMFRCAPYLFRGAVGHVEMAAPDEFLYIRLGGALVGLLNACARKDVIGFAAIAATMSDVSWDAAQQVDFSSIESLYNQFPGLSEWFIDGNMPSLEVVPKELEDAPTVTMGAKEETPSTPDEDKPRERTTQFSDILPKYVKMSGPGKAMVTLCTVVSGSQIFKDSVMVKKLAEYIDYEKLMEDTTSTVIVYRCMREIARGVNAVVEKKDFGAFFLPPVSMVVIDRAETMIRPVDTMMSTEDICKEILEIDSLLLSVAYEWPTPDLSRAKTALRNLKWEHQKALKKTTNRKIPFVVFLYGEPGVGKTTLIGGLINQFAVKDGVPRFNGDTINVNIFDKYPASTGLNQDARYVVLNDVTADYTNFPNQDLIPLDLLIQQMVDSNVFYFRGAAIEDKGVALNNVSYVIITSNNKSFKMVDDAAKLVRRFSGGALFDIGFATADKTPVAVSFRELGVSAKGKHLEFVETNATRNLSRREFVDTVFRAKARFDASEESRIEKFGINSKLCSCGGTLAFHNERGVYIALTDSCDLKEIPKPPPPPPPAPVANPFDVIILKDLAVPAETRAIIPVAPDLSPHGEAPPAPPTYAEIARGLLRDVHFLHPWDDPLEEKSEFALYIPVLLPVIAAGGILGEFFGFGRVLSGVIFGTIYEELIKLGAVVTFGPGAIVVYALLEFANYTVFHRIPAYKRLPALIFHIATVNFTIGRKIFCHLVFNYQVLRTIGDWDYIANAGVLCLEHAETIVSAVMVWTLFVFFLGVVIGTVPYALVATLLAFGLVRWMWPNMVAALASKLRTLAAERQIANILVRGARLASMPKSLERAIRLNQRLGELKKFVADNKVMIAAFIAGTAIAAAAWSISSPRNETAGPAQSIMSKDVKPETLDTRMPTVAKTMPGLDKARQWAQRTSNVFVLEPKTLNVGPTDLAALARKATVPAKIARIHDHKVSVAEVRAFLLSPALVCINAHYLYDPANGEWCKTFDLTINEICARFSFEDDVFRDPDTEIVFVRNLFVPGAANLCKFFPTTDTAEAIQAFYVKPDVNELVAAYTTQLTEPVTNVTYTSWAWKGRVEKGECGTPLISAGRDAVILGLFSFIHTYALSFGTYGGVTKMNQSVIERANKFFGVPVVQMAAVEYPEGVNELAPRSEWWNVGSPYIHVIGTAPGATRSFSSKIKKTVLYDSVLPKVKKSFAIPRAIRGLTAAGTWNSAMMNQFKYVNLPDASPYSLKRKAMLGYLRDCLATDRTGIKLAPLSLKEAVFGAPEVGVDRIVFKTSLGSRLRKRGFKTKNDLFLKAEDSEELEFHPEVREEIDGLLGAYSEGKVPGVVVDFTPKDEVRETSKVLDYKIRLFAVADFVYNITLRMLVMPIISYLLNYRFQSGCMGTMNAGSPEWGKLAEWITAVGGKVFDIDFSAFDTSHSISMFWIGAEFFYLLSAELGYELKFSEMLYFSVWALCIQLVIYLNDYAVKLKGLPSGVTITLILNSIINAVLLRMAFLVLVPDIPLSEFRNHVREALVGDDNLSGVSDEVAERFNTVTIFRLYHEWGYVATPANKSGVAEKYGKLEDQTFLKRKFVKDPSGHWFAPLEEDSIWKALMFERTEAGVTPLDRLYDCAQNAQREFFLHGRERFDRAQIELVELFTGVELQPPKLLSFDLLMEEFTEGKFITADL